jgi:hypothetical protein
MPTAWIQYGSSSAGEKKTLMALGGIVLPLSVPPALFWRLSRVILTEFSEAWPGA